MIGVNSSLTICSFQHATATATPTAATSTRSCSTGQATAGTASTVPPTEPDPTVSAAATTTTSGRTASASPATVTRSVSPRRPAPPRCLRTLACLCDGAFYFIIIFFVGISGADWCFKMFDILEFYFFYKIFQSNF